MSTRSTTTARTIGGTPKSATSRLRSISPDALKHPPLGAGKPDGVDFLDGATSNHPVRFSSEEKAEDEAFEQWFAKASVEEVGTVFDGALDRVFGRAR